MEVTCQGIQSVDTDMTVWRLTRLGARAAFPIAESSVFGPDGKRQSVAAKAQHHSEA